MTNLNKQRALVLAKRTNISQLEQDILKAGCSVEQLDKYRKYVFEISYREARFLNLYPKSKTDELYFKAVADMFRINYRNGLLELREVCESNKHLEGTILLHLDYKGINDRIKKKYNLK